MTLFVNKNALPGTVLTSAKLQDGPNIFAVKPLHLKTDNLTERNGFPTFTATLEGITNSHPYFMLDLTSDHSIFWASNCSQSGSLGTGSCSSAPTLMETGFNPANNQSGIIERIGTYTNAPFGGYVSSGTKYSSRFCMADGICKDIVVYSAEDVSQDNWLYDLDGTFGIIGIGPSSSFWNGYTDPFTLRSNYSISLGRISAQALIPASNITFGGASVSEYFGAKYAEVVALANYSYALDNFAFGIVYQTNGIDTSEYFMELQNYYPVVFTTNFIGLGLPSEVWESVTSLIDKVSHGAVSCSREPDGVCVLAEKCENYVAFSDYTFRFNFTDVTNMNYIRVPLAAFA